MMMNSNFGAQVHGARLSGMGLDFSNKLWTFPGSTNGNKISTIIIFSL